MFYGFWAIFMVFFSCEIGHRFSNAYEEMYDKIFHLDWYLLSMDLQRMLPTLLIYTQKSVDIECFGSTTCGRDTFKKVEQEKKIVQRKMKLFNK